MDLGEKAKHLRVVEGIVRGLSRPMTKAEVVRQMQAELGQTISHAYLSQIESGARPHLTEATRDLLARFFKVHPGYLVSDPPDWEPTLSVGPLSDVERLKAWLIAQADLTQHEPILSHLLVKLARKTDPRRFIWLFDRLIDVPIEEAERRVQLDLAPEPDRSVVEISATGARPPEGGQTA